ncbi:type I-E CRISPR-associated protein Cas6/Cse3/CasE [Lactobacillus sp. ESL0684]|uniref:type I-E CRISPR-associated protein Cas6/Cse3/CasE n=1 Tax=Lactobacillus sp. ESL0684 TaxID=2983213 RepID=UPI0023FA00EA|nr:type I-E CRISPR-associated protein Cas6/Cse3/CasE [Lactobacillus sp. ESL0684]WEV43553.1 type I-E CRISPR-associated protein Cas6/Cse3/CasE [Lactobacillus sp. ESL0684]
MYLSRVEIDTDNRQKIKDLVNLAAYHNWVEQSFPEEIAVGERRRHLWRIDQLNGRQYLLVLSENQPDKDKLLRYGKGEVTIKDYDHLLSILHEGQVLQFRLTANPTRTVSVPGSKQGRVFPHVTVEQQSKWLADRAPKAGFQLEFAESENDESQNTSSFKIVSRDWPILSNRKSRRVKLSRVSYEGILQITDVEQFRQTLMNGIGREKAFGMGLMTVIPVANR